MKRMRIAGMITMVLGFVFLLASIGECRVIKGTTVSAIGKLRASAVSKTGAAVSVPVKVTKRVVLPSGKPRFTGTFSVNVKTGQKVQMVFSSVAKNGVAKPITVARFAKIGKIKTNQFKVTPPVKKVAAGNRKAVSPDINLGTIVVASATATPSINPLTQVDSDGDGTPDLTDTDDDNDHISDATDTDSDGNGVVDVKEDMDTDNDGTPNAVDTDDDNDGIPDSSDSDDDGDHIADWDGDSDQDGDSVPDSIDPDDDNDGIVDSSDTDMNGNGLADATENDSDGDGIPDDDDNDDDNDGIPDSQDNDDDGDGIPDINEQDSDGDGVPDDADAFPEDPELD